MCTSLDEIEEVGERWVVDCAAAGADADADADADAAGVAGIDAGAAEAEGAGTTSAFTTLCTSASS